MATQRRPAAVDRKRPVPSRAQQALVGVLRTADHLRASADAIVAPHGITGQQYNVLRILRGAEPEGLPTLTIAERMIERTPGITRMIDRLEAKGLVTRERRGPDRRCVHCRVTVTALELLGKLDSPVEEGNRRAFAMLTPQELATFLALVNRIRAGIGDRESGLPAEARSQTGTGPPSPKATAGSLRLHS